MKFQIRSKLFILMVFISACSIVSGRSENETTEDHQKTAESSADTPAPVVSVEGQHGTVPTQNVDSPHHAFPEGGVPPQKAMGWLKNGNTRFVKAYYRKDGKSSMDRVRLTKGQHPHTILITCADSRVPPELIFDQALGEIFVIRVAGEALDPNVIASVEYATAHLGTRLVVVMGHTKCGAVAAALDTPTGQSAGSPSLDHLVGDIQPRLTRHPASLRSPDLYKESFDNAKGVASDLINRSSMLGDYAQSGHVKIISAIYNLKTGKVDFAE